MWKRKATRNTLNGTRKIRIFPTMKLEPSFRKSLRTRSMPFSSNETHFIRKLCFIIRLCSESFWKRISRFKPTKQDKQVWIGESRTYKCTEKYVQKIPRWKTKITRHLWRSSRKPFQEWMYSMWKNNYKKSQTNALKGLTISSVRILINGMNRS